jgi:hypothetical protein
MKYGNSLFLFRRTCLLTLKHVKSPLPNITSKRGAVDMLKASSLKHTPELKPLSEGAK